jgi:hypothetical protein
MDGNINVEFALECLGRRDEEAGVYVGYIPALHLYTQATTSIGQWLTLNCQLLSP